MVSVLWKTVWWSLQKLKIELSYDPAVPLLGTYPKILMHKDVCVPIFTALFTIAKIWKQPKCPLMDDWTKIVWYVDKVDYCSALRNEIWSLLSTDEL